MSDHKFNLNKSPIKVLVPYRLKVSLDNQKNSRNTGETVFSTIYPRLSIKSIDSPVILKSKRDNNFSQFNRTGASHEFSSPIHYRKWLELEFIEKMNNFNNTTRLHQP